MTRQKLGLKTKTCSHIFHQPDHFSCRSEWSDMYQHKEEKVCETVSKYCTPNYISENALKMKRRRRRSQFCLVRKKDFVRRFFHDQFLPKLPAISRQNDCETEKPPLKWCDACELWLWPLCFEFRAKLWPSLQKMVCLCLVSLGTLSH